MKFHMWNWNVAAGESAKLDDGKVFTYKSERRVLWVGKTLKNVHLVGENKRRDIEQNEFILFYV